MRGDKRLLLAVLLCCGAVLASCTGINAPPAVKDAAGPNEYTFAVPYDEAWKGTVRALAEGERIDTLDRESGLLVTEYKTINKIVESLGHAATFGRIYKNGYTIQLREEAPGRTQISIRSRLLLEHLTVYSSALQDESLEAYLRQELFRKICMNLLPEPRRCTALFPDYHQVSVSCSAPATSEAGASDTADAPGRAGQTKKASIRQVQQALLVAGFAPGPVDGRLGPMTRAALRLFQQDRALEDSGAIDWSTLQALGL
jgi:hypothetical protein